MYLWKPKKQKYTATSYAFYLFPPVGTSSAADKKFVCQLSSLAFLAQHGFDFNKTFHEGWFTVHF